MGGKKSQNGKKTLFLLLFCFENQEAVCQLMIDFIH
jgi:hypothetical protein